MAASMEPITAATIRPRAMVISGTSSESSRCTARLTSTSKMSATFSNMTSSRPLSSPTRTSCTASPGKTSVCSIGLLGGAKADAARIQVDRLSSVLDLYMLDAGSYPSEEEGLEALVEQPAGTERWNGPYLKKAESLIDPWGQPYVYRYPGEHGEYDLYSLGADGQVGGEGRDEDVTNW